MMRLRALPLLCTFALSCTVPAVHAGGTYPSVLPAEAEVRGILESSPLVAEAAAGVPLGEALRQRRLAGPHEWAVRATTQERRDHVSQQTFTETQVTLERGFRLPGKGPVDTALGQQAREVAEFTFADAWHEAGRLFLGTWFDWLREGETVKVLASQVAIMKEQRTAVDRRVAAGDAPALEGRLAEAELNRVVALGLEARDRLRQRELDLKELFPGATLAAPDTLDTPSALDEPDSTWLERIRSDSHELELALAEQKQADLEAQRARLDRLPDPTVGVHYGRERAGDEKVLGVTVAIPFGGRGRRADHAAALARATMAAARARQASLRVDGDSGRVLSATRLGRERWEQLSRLAESMSATASAMRRGYTAGEIDLGEALLADRQSLDATLSARTAQLDALEAYARLRLDAHEIWALDHDHPGD